MPALLIEPSDKWSYPDGIRPGDPVTVGENIEGMGMTVGRVVSRAEASSLPKGTVRPVTFQTGGHSYSVPVYLARTEVLAEEKAVKGILGKDGSMTLTVHGKRGKKLSAKATVRLDAVPGDRPTEYLGEYSRALDAQLEMLQFAESQTGRLWLYHIAEEDRDLAAQWVKSIRAHTAYGDPFYVTPEISAQIANSSLNLPLQQLDEEMLPSMHGFVFFEKPLPMPALPDLPGHNSRPIPDDIHAMGWSMTVLKRGGFNEDSHGVSLTYYSRPDGPSLRPVVVVFVAYGETQEDYRRHAVEHERVKCADDPDLAFDKEEDEPNYKHWSVVRRLRMNYTYGFFRFLQQRILIPSHPYAPSRNTRKRAEKVWDQVPNIRIVEFRKSKHVGEPREGRDGWTLQCSFVVGSGTGGFYQTYHTKAGVQKRWINPYVKGQGLPPKKTQTTINVVRR